jgi:hypothetical protein
MDGISDEKLFKLWKRSFLEAVREAIFRANGLSFYHKKKYGGGVPSLIVEVPEIDYRGREYLHLAFIDDFRKICLKRNFDPSRKKDRWGPPAVGDLSESFAEYSSRFYKLLKKNFAGIKHYHHLDRKINKRHRKRNRLDPALAKKVVFILEMFRDKTNSQSLLKDFFSETGDFKKYVGGQKKVFLRYMKQFRSVKGYGDFSGNYDPIVPSSIVKLGGSRDHKSIMWASHWKQDLMRNLLSDNEIKIIKNLEGKKKQKDLLLKEILAQEEKTIRKNLK